MDLIKIDELNKFNLNFIKNKAIVFIPNTPIVFIAIGLIYRNQLTNEINKLKIVDYYVFGWDRLGNQYYLTSKVFSLYSEALKFYKSILTPQNPIKG